MRELGLNLAPRQCATRRTSLCDITMRVSVKSVFLGYKYATAKMLEQPAHRSGDRGWIINMSSIMGIIAGLDNRKFDLTDDLIFA
ncbi:hypothetical protein AWENTII_009088 [Aspergillus wentii]